MPKLVIVESPAKAKTIKKYLGGDYRVVASMGHVRDLPKSQLGIDIEHNYEPKYISIRGKSQLINSIKKEAKGCEKIYLATDPDREGEAISWHLAQLLGLELTDDVRVIFNEITKNAVVNGVKHPRGLDMNLVDAQQARRVLDRLVGYQISPFLWRKIRKGLSAGRVQSVATKLIVDREKEIEAFQPEEYWTIDVRLEKDEKSFLAHFYVEDKFDVKNEAEAEKIRAFADGADYRVRAVKKGEKRRNPAAPFITSSLQQDASRKLSMPVRRTMQIAQELYEGVEITGVGLVGLITYMRTDSLRVSNEALAEVRSYIGENYESAYLPKSPRVYKTKSGAQDAHEAIRPTMVSLTPERIKKNLSADQYNIYKLIWERFVASQMASQVLDTVAAEIDCTREGREESYLFKASGSVVKFPGFTVLYEEGRDDKEEEAARLPDLAQGDALRYLEALPKQHFTVPPPRYSEALLIKTLEENGIGRPSTYAPTITTIQQREYVVKEGKVFKPTALGELTTELMQKSFSEIVDVDFTAHMEDDLDRIEEGKESWKSVIDRFYKPFSKMLEKAEKDLEGVHLKVPDEETDETCELCGRKMVVKTGRYGKFLACPGYPECKNTKPLIKDTGAVCPKCGGRIVEKKSKNGNKYYGCEHNPQCDFMTWYQPTGEKCPKCGSAMLLKNSWKKDQICANEACGYTIVPEKKPKEQKKETEEKK